LLGAERNASDLALAPPDDFGLVFGKELLPGCIDGFTNAIRYVE
jgi:hypothetical protein